MRTEKSLTNVQARSKDDETQRVVESEDIPVGEADRRVTAHYGRTQLVGVRVPPGRSVDISQEIPGGAES